MMNSRKISTNAIGFQLISYFMNVSFDDNELYRLFEKYLDNKLVHSPRAKAEWFENRLKAERAWFLDRRERRAKPETEQALPRWGKACVFSNHSA